MAGLPPVNIQFVAGGVSNVMSAIKTLEQAFTQLESKITQLAKKGADDRVNAFQKEFASKKSIAEKFASEYNAILEKEVNHVRSAAQKKEEIERHHTQVLRNEAHKRGQIFQSALQSMGVQGVSAQSHIAGQMVPVGVGGGFIGSAALLSGGAAFFGGSGFYNAAGQQTNLDYMLPEGKANDARKLRNVALSSAGEMFLKAPGARQQFLSDRSDRWGGLVSGIKERIDNLHDFKMPSASRISDLVGWKIEDIGFATAGAMKKAPKAIGSFIGEHAGELGKAGLVAGSMALIAGSLMLFKKGLDLVTGSLSKAASEMVSGVTTIGGGFSIGSSLVKAASLETSAAQIVANALPEPGVGAPSRGEVLSWAKGSARGGEHTAEQFLGGLRAYQGLTGRTSQFMKMAPFIGKLASVSGAPFEQLAMGAAQAGLQFQNFSAEQIQDIMLKQWQAGREGAIEIKDAQTMARVTAGARMLSGGPTVANYMKQIGMVQIARRSVSSPEEATTAYERFQQFAATHSGEIEALGGQKVLNKQSQFTNMSQTVADAIKILMTKGYGTAEKLFGREGIRMVQAAAGVTGGTYDKDAVAMIDTIVNTKASLNDLDIAFKEVTTTTAYELKQAFNELTEEVGSSLLIVLKESGPQVKGLLKDLVKSVPNLMAEFLALSTVLPIVGDAFIALGPLVIELSKLLLSAVGWMTDMSPEQRATKGAEFEGLLIRLENMRKGPEEKQGQRAQDVGALMSVLNSPELKGTRGRYFYGVDEESFKKTLLSGTSEERASAISKILTRSEQTGGALKGSQLEGDLKRILSLETGNAALTEAAYMLMGAAEKLALLQTAGHTPLPSTGPNSFLNWGPANR